MDDHKNKVKDKDLKHMRTVMKYDSVMKINNANTQKYAYYEVLN